MSTADGSWRDCAHWLTRCGAIRAEHKVNRPESTIDDLAHTLRDGVILCNLLNILEPGCLGTKDINQKPQMAQVIILIPLSPYEWEDVNNNYCCISCSILKIIQIYIIFYTVFIAFKKSIFINLIYITTGNKDSIWGREKVGASAHQIVYLSWERVNVLFCPL